MTQLVPAVFSAGAVLLLGVATFAGLPFTVAAVLLVLLGLALGWGVVLDLPDGLGSGIVVGLTGVAACATALAAREAQQPLAPFTGLIAIGLLVAFAHELVRGGTRDRVVDSVAGTLSGQVLAMLAASWILLPGTELGQALVLVAAAAVLAARLVFVVSPPHAGYVALVAGGVAGAAVSMAPGVSGLAVATAFVTGLAVAGGTAGLDRLLVDRAARLGVTGMLAAVASPVAAAGAVAYAVGRMLTT